MNKVKVNILSPGRFHVCDLARELDMNGYDVKFYSFVPARETSKYGLPRHCSASVIGVVGIFLLLERKIFKKQQWARRLRILAQDYFTAFYMRRCDICISMSGDFVYSLEVAKRNGAIVILERGSKHILEQRRILDSIPSNKGKKTVPDINVERELAGYKIANYIAIAAKHVKESFIKHDFPEDKLFINPYGVDLSMFKHLTINDSLFHELSRKYHSFLSLRNVDKILRNQGKFDMIMVGQWSYQKGCDLICDALKDTEYKLLHVGSVADVPFPDSPNFIHLDAVPQSDLIFFYNLSKIFLMPSRQDGFGMVYLQAMACNLPIIGSKDSGAPEIKERVKDPNKVTIIDEYTTESLKILIDKAYAQFKEFNDNPYAGDAINYFSWNSYGKRYSVFLKKVVLNGGKNN